MREWFVNVTNGLGSMYRARSWRRAVALLVMAPVLVPLILLAWLLFIPWTFYMAWTWDGT